MSEPGILPSPIPFGKYYLLERVNVGGMAEVYKAKAFGEEGFERILAVKKILASIAEDEDFINMFIDEAKITGRLNHPNICQVFDLGIADGSHFIAMEYIAGKDLKTIFERGRRLGERVNIPKICFEIMKVCEGLSHAHSKKNPQGQPLGIVHRDISPQNILVSYEGAVKIIDFGIAKASGKTSQTQVGILKGKFSYMSPEQVRGLHVDHRSDIFSLGIVMYELLTLERLFLGESDFDTLEKIRKVEMSPPSLYNPHIPQELERICLKALAKSPEERFQTCGEFAEALEKFMRSQGFYFSNKDLAVYMKEAFSADIEFEAKKLDYYRSLNLKPIEAGQPDVQAVSQRPSRGLSWGEEEMETQIFDREEDETIEANALQTGGSARPTVEFDRWDGDGLPSFSDEKPAKRTAQHTEQIEAISPIHPTERARTVNRSKDSRLLLYTAIGVFLIGGLAAFAWYKLRPTMAVETEPTSVEIWVNGEMVHNGETPHNVVLPTGPVLVELKREGFETYKKDADAELGRNFRLKRNLKAIVIEPEKPKNTKMMVKTSPAGAAIEINGKKYEKVTPFSIDDLGAGPYVVNISKEGFLPESRTLKKLSAKGLDVRLKPSQISLAINSKPSRSRFSVYLENGKKVLHSGKTPQTIKDLDASKRYRVVVKRSEYDTWEDVMEPGFEKESTVEASLVRKSEKDAKNTDEAAAAEREKKKAEIFAKREQEKKEKEKRDKAKAKKEKEKEKEKKAEEEAAGTGFLYVQSNPVARVYINGRDTGRYTPLLKFKIASGKKHRIKLVNDEYGLSKTYYVRVKPGAKKKIVNKK